MASEITIDYETQDWFTHMAQEIHAIATETLYRSRMELIEGKWAVGERICADSQFKKIPGSKEAFLSNLFRAAGIGERDGYYCVSFYQKYPKFRTDMQSFSEGKNLSWNKVKTIYLTDAKDVIPPDFKFVKLTIEELKLIKKALKGLYSEGQNPSQVLAQLINKIGEALGD